MPPDATRRGSAAGVLSERDWSLVKSLFDQALAADPKERERILAAVPDLRAEVESLLEAHERAGTFLASGEPVQPRPDDPLLGQRLGPYEVTGLLGRGGMGAVYLARRESPSRTVAIKVVRPGAESVETLGRIQAEAEILARLDHPNIARLLDTGTTPQGRPYVVMEYLDGVPLERYCAQHRPDLRARLTLFAQLCDAVAYAHRRLVVHRDLKPGNVLVTAAGEPKLLDFGIGKLLDDERPAARTRTGMWLMTPEYASPEQVRGEPVSVSTDVHALGLLLHVLLTGRSPVRLVTGSPEELVRVICLEVAPPASKAALASGSRAFEPLEAGPRLARLLRGELDAIVAQALRKETDRRYASVEHLAEDVRAHLDGRLVRAQKDTLTYRARKFVRRNRLGVAAAAAVGLALVGGAAATAWQARVARAQRARAERRFADVRRMANAMLFAVYDSIRDLPGSTPARKMLASQALQYLDGLGSEAPGDAALQRELAVAYRRVGDVQGQSGAANLGDTAGAMASYRKALALYDTLAAAAPRNAGVQAERLSCLINVARLEESDVGLDAAVATLNQALAVGAAAVALDPANVGLQSDLVKAAAQLGKIRVYQGDYDTAIDVLDRAVKQAEAATAARPDSAELRGALSQAFINLARARRDAREFPVALELYRRAQALHETLAAADPVNARPRRSLALVSMETGYVLAGMERWAEAERSGQDALAISTALQAADPTNAEPGRMILLEEQLLCRARAHTAQRVAPACRSAVARAQARAVANPMPSNTLDVVYAYGNLGQALQDAGDSAGAFKAFQDQLQLLADLRRASPDDQRTLGLAADAQAGLGKALSMNGEWARALLAYAEAITLTEPSSGARTADALARLIDLHCSVGDVHARRAAQGAAPARRAAWAAAREAYARAALLLEGVGARTYEALQPERARARRGLAESERSLHLFVDAAAAAAGH